MGSAFAPLHGARGDAHSSSSGCAEVRHSGDELQRDWRWRQSIPHPRI